MYWAAGERLISLDRVRFKAALDVDGKIALIPTAIVRPIQAVPAVRLETVYLIPPDLQEKQGIDSIAISRRRKAESTILTTTLIPQTLQKMPTSLGSKDREDIPSTQSN